MKFWDRVNQRPFWAKLLNWEYWPGKAFYYPLIPHILMLMLRARHICFFTAANPGIYTGGLGLESKFDTLRKIPEPYRPKSCLIPSGTPFGEVLAELAATGITFPLIAKPDLGFRGFLVSKLDTEPELRAYLSKYPIDIILQEYLRFPEEIGVLYYRLPDTGEEGISSITTKEFLYVTGDGRATVLELIREKARAHLQLERIRAQHPELLLQVPAAGERITLGIVGNHSKGTRFINSTGQADEGILKTISRLARQVDGFYYGRFDLKCTSFDSLRTGEGIKIIELNGVCSEPTHIYDPQRGTYFSALRDIAYHWSLISRIARANHRRGTPYMEVRKLARAFLDLFAYQRMIADVERGEKR
ncbi:MAG: hypothetical protein H6564_23225 [Lewinellaceae bacterium]|nr:hypothetical protein [Lewinellaceae bacterium]